MRKFFLIVSLLLMTLSSVFAQDRDQRTLQTKIADLLAEMPAVNSARFNAAMEDLANMGEPGITGLATMLKSPGKGDNSKIEYALSGFAYYVTKPGREAMRQMSEKAFANALAKVSDPVNKAFLMAQLQTVGDEDVVVSVLKTYLHDDQLADPAVRALIQTSKDIAGKEILAAAISADGASRLSLVKALGDMHYKDGLSFLTSLSATNDLRTKYVVNDALAKIGDVSSLKILKDGAQKSGYVFDETNANNSYLTFLNRLIENGNQAVAKKELNSLLKNTKQDNQVSTRIAALHLLSAIQSNQDVKLLTAAMSDKNAEYRAAALAAASENINPVTASSWLKTLKKAKPGVQAEIISMLGNSNELSVLHALQSFLNNKDKGVALAAIQAVGKMGGEKSLPALLALMQNGSPDVVTAVKQAIRIMPGNDVVNQVAKVVPVFSGNAQASLIELLGLRHATEQSALLLPLLSSTNDEVRKASFSALPSMVGAKDLPALSSLIKSDLPAGDLAKVQDATIAALGSMSGSSEKSAYVLKEMQGLPASKKALYYRVLSAIGDQPSLQVVEAGFGEGDANVRQMAVDALSQWNGVNALEPLFKIGKETNDASYLDKVVAGYIKAVDASSYPADQKLLLLRKVMEIAKTDAQKQMILKSAGNNKTFNTIVFAGNYLDDPALQQPAARIVMNVALSDKQFSGEIVRGLLNKTLTVLKGSDSDYEKEAVRKFLAEMPEGPGWISIFNGKDLTGWKGLVANPVKRSQMDSKALAKEQEKADEVMRKGWYAKDGELVFTGKGDNICTTKDYGDFEMYVDWKIDHGGDAGIYLRGSPQVQIWDTSRRDVGAQVGSGGLYNNVVNQDKPLKLADNAIGDWNHFYIKMQGDRVTVYLNGELVTDNTIMENYWDRKMPIFSVEQLELQAHGTEVFYRDIYIREIPRPKPFVLSEEESKEGYKILFDGTNMHEWTGATDSYVLEDGNIVIHPDRGRGGNLYTKDEYGDFSFRFDFQLTPGANNGVGIRAPLEGDAAYVGMEIQILDNDADIYKDLHEYQYHGSVYGVIPAKRGFLKPVGEWNSEEIIAKGNKIKVILNGTVILDGDIAEASKNGTIDGNAHPGLKNAKGHIGFLGHGSLVKFRNIRIKDLSK